MRNKRFVQWCVVAACTTVTLFLTVTNLADEGAKDKKVAEAKYRGLLGEGNRRIKVEGDKTYVWSGMNDATGEPEWFDFTGSPIPPEELQFGIGKDRIRSIDDPLYVDPKDPRLMKLGQSPYRRDERPASADDIMVIGFADGKDVRAYPIALLDSHELVNDTINGKPVTVGW